MRRHPGQGGLRGGDGERHLYREGAGGLRGTQGHAGLDGGLADPPETIPEALRADDLDEALEELLFFRRGLAEGVQHRVALRPEERAEVPHVGVADRGQHRLAALDGLAGLGGCRLLRSHWRRRRLGGRDDVRCRGERHRGGDELHRAHGLVGVGLHAHDRPRLVHGHGAGVGHRLCPTDDLALVLVEGRDVGVVEAGDELLVREQRQEAEGDRLRDPVEPRLQRLLPQEVHGLTGVGERRVLHAQHEHHRHTEGGGDLVNPTGPGGEPFRVAGVLGDRLVGGLGAEDGDLAGVLVAADGLAPALLEELRGGVAQRHLGRQDARRDAEVLLQLLVPDGRVFLGHDRLPDRRDAPEAVPPIEGVRPAQVRHLLGRPCRVAVLLDPQVAADRAVGVGDNPPPRRVDRPELGADAVAGEHPPSREGPDDLDRRVANHLEVRDDEVSEVRARHLRVRVVEQVLDRVRRVYRRELALGVERPEPQGRHGPVLGEDAGADIRPRVVGVGREDRPVVPALFEGPVGDLVGAESDDACLGAEQARERVTDRQGWLLGESGGATRPEGGTGGGSRNHWLH